MVILEMPFVLLNTISAFYYDGETIDRMMIYTTNVGWNPDQQTTCICHMPRWQPYVRLTKTGRSMVVTTDASCLENIHAQAILELQAGFRPGFAPCLPGKSYQDSIIFSIIGHSKSLCSSRFNIHDTDIQLWRRELIQEISTRLREHEVGMDLKPFTGWIDFASATNAFSRWK